ncbi:DUF3037 domain-containing protein [Flammeovirga kamogawensis]|uniref:DUF3037 domain-containing protein n=1 Tax=Flammeovirga kamogawensis TaxID=373891 RepID=A0ABX8H0Q4_9BACT|nr:DUF3037 domain-containing protein [Flammeovirga kamogawensis]MBB6462194.1 hypothetical protein [Flammeovirga kamogawensis]QWG09405.1 DUF3037 domain-containing protein [Flammeovirga kamogawensis]TRX64923.1 DUF3037 domain-containing protein [Flammeovirga kamogawensis]
MQDKQVYEYAVIRFVPKVEREEFINVGVILFCKGLKYLDLKYKVVQKKLDAFDVEIDQKQLETYLQTWKLICEGGTKGGVIGEQDLPNRFRWLTATRSTLIQSSKVHPGLCIHPPEEILEHLFNKYIG